MSLVFSEASKTSPTVHAGQILIYRVFDIADEIDLVAAERLFKQTVGEARVRIGAGKPQATIIIRNAPLRLPLRELELQLPGETLTAAVVATIWDYGAVSICLQLPLQGV